jgi:hypothetical protein
MSHRIAAYTLFDITQTGVMNRSKPTGDNLDIWIYQRNTQCNFDTLLQVISMRSQPEIVKFPNKILLKEEDFDKFGFLYSKEEDKIKHFWRFEFDVQHSSVFENGIIALGSLYNDCDGVPMILCKDQLEKVPAFLDVTDELRNIYFELI